jgi:predicted RNA-binding Zn ribbon-like protein
MSRVSPYLPSFVGGAASLDFVNTVDPRHAEDRDDCLRSYQELVRWAQAAGLLTAAESSDLKRRAEADPGAADAVHRRALDLREALYRLLTPKASSASHPSRGDGLALLNDEAHRASAMAELTPTDGGWSWQWKPTPDLDRMLWPIVRSATELLTSDRRDRVRECEGANGCGWLFVDTSKSGRRRWCDMRVCGNRAKARRHRERGAANSRSS